MKLPSFENVRWYSLVVGLTAVLAVLATLQYSASRQVSELNSEQMRTNLQASLLDLRGGLERELAPLCRALDDGLSLPAQGDLPEYVDGLERWRRVTPHPHLVAAFYVWRAANTKHSRLLQLNSDGKSLVATVWPSEFAQLHDQLQATFRDSNAGPPPPPAGEPGGEPRPPKSSWPGGSDVPQHAMSRADRAREGAEPPPSGEVPPDEPGGPPGGPSRPEGRGAHSWMIDQNTPALVHGIWEIKGRRAASRRARATLTLFIVKLNMEVIGHEILPELSERYFGSSHPSSYELAVIAENMQRAVVYSSDPGFGQTETVPDMALNLFGPPDPVLGGANSPAGGLFVSPAPRHLDPRVEQGDPFGPTNELRDEERLEIDPMRYSREERGWEIIAKHRKGSVEAAATALYHRSLAINFGVLLVLATTMEMIIATSRRARRLARLQMDFVAGVSHELRTPLTGIVSAAQNIADGLVENKARMMRYGTAIMTQAQQLTDLVEQILMFSATAKRRHRYHFRVVDVAEVIGASVKNTSELIRSAGFTLEQQIQPQLPSIMADFKALSQLLQNLIANSVKYGGESRWVEIRALIADNSSRSKEIRITVQDKGIGIGRDDLKHIFEPFYRSPVATSAQIHGSGLGLPLAKSIAEAMGGRLTVESAPQRGSAFTVHLPIKENQSARTQPSATADGNSIS